MEPIILIVEDDSAHRRTLKASLAAYGYGTLEANDGCEASSLFETHRFNLIVLASSAAESILALCTRLRSRSEVAGVPIVALADNLSDEEFERCLDAGASDVFPRSGGMRLLARRLRRLTGESRPYLDLQRSEQLYRKIVEESFQGISITQDWTVVFANQVLARMFGYEDASEMLGVDCRLWTPEPERKRIQTYNAARLSGRAAPERYEVQAVRRNGVWFWVECQVTIIQWQGASASLVVSIDITERKRAEAALRASETRFGAFFHANPMPCAIFSLPDERIVEVNKAFLDGAGVEASEVTGRTSAEIGWLVEPEKRDQALCAIREGGTPFSYESSVRLKSGRMRHCMIVYERFDVEDQSFYLVMLFDITRRREAEEAIRESKNKLEEITSAIPGLVYQHRMATDGDSRYLFLSRDVANAYGFTFDFERMSARELLSIVHPDDYKLVAESGLAAIQSCAPWICEFRTVDKDGQIRWLLGQSLQRRMMDGSVISNGILSDITLYKRTQDALRASEELLRQREEGFRLLFEKNPLPMWLFDRETQKFLAVNDVASIQYGYSEAEFLNLRLADVYAPEEFSRLGAQLGKTDAEIQFAGEWRHRLKTGRIIDVEITAHAFDFAGRPAQFVLARDITDRKRAESALRESELKFARFFHGTPLPCLISSLPEGRITEANNALLQASGFTRDEVIGKTTLELNLFTEPETRNNIMRIVRDGKTPYIYESRFRRKDGEIRAFIGALERVEIGGKSYYVGMFYDITDRKRAERSLRESEAKFAKLFRANPLPCSIARISDERLVDVNDAFCAVTGFCREDVIGRTSLEMNAIVNPEERASVFQATREGRTPHVQEVAFRIPSGEIRNCIVATERLEISGEAYALAMIYDITDSRRLDAERLRLSKLESVSVLAGGIAHDFNNLLTAILGNVALAKQYAAVSPRAVAKLEAVERAGGRAKSLSKRLLTFARGGEPVRESTALPPLVQESMQFVLHGSLVEGHFIFPSELWNAMTDAGQIEQVFQNLALNAREAMPNGGLLEIKARNVALDAPLNVPLEAGKYVKISVRDTGAGIPRDQLPKIFDPYFTTKPTGSGLGLAVVHSIVTKHHGYVAVHSEIGVGTTFDVYLPAAPSSGPEGEKKSLDFSAADLDRARRRILVMDDEEMVREMTCSLLEELGYRVQECRDGAEAVERYVAARSSGSPFDAVVMDLVVLGGVGGREALEKLLAIDENVQAIVCSGYSSDQVMANFKKYGFCGKLEKPFSLEDLQNVLEGVFLQRE